MHSSTSMTTTLSLLLTLLHSTTFALPQQPTSDPLGIAASSSSSTNQAPANSISADGTITPRPDLGAWSASQPVCDTYTDPQLPSFHISVCEGNDPTQPAGPDCMGRSCDAAIAYLCNEMNTTAAEHDQWTRFEQPGEDCWGGMWLPGNVGSYGLEECRWNFLGRIQSECTGVEAGRNGGHVNLVYGPGQKNPTPGGETRMTGEAVDSGLPSYYLKPRSAV